MRTTILFASLGAIAASAFAQSNSVDGVTSTQAPQTPAEGSIVAGQAPGTERWIAHFSKRSFDLGAFRQAVLDKRPAAEVAAIVADMERKVELDQAAFVTAVRSLGGTVVKQWWLINAAAFEIAPGKLDAVAKVDGVARLEADRWVYPSIRTATNANNHNSDAVNAAGNTGLGVAAAIMDTGQDENMGGTGRPHRMYFINGDPTNTGGGGIGGSRLVVNRLIGTVGPDDPHNHGTGVAGIVLSGGWLSAGADAGHAPRAQAAGYGISENTGGGSSFTTIANAWQAIAADKVQFNIVSANNSYSGTPDPLNASQQALDSAALNADIMVCVAAANNGASTAASQSCANGLAVAAVNPNTHTVATFSSRGPLSGDTQRFYPDIAACGVSTVMPLRDNESSDYVASGTSMASPQVCGAATLIRAADPAMRADETKAVLLASTLDISTQNPSPPYNSRNAYGMGLLKDDYAMDTTLRTRGDHGRNTVSSGTTTWRQNFTVTPGVNYQFAIAWMRSNFSVTTWANLDLEIRQGTTVLASSATTRNLYERVTFAPTGTTVTAVVTGTSFETGTTSQDFGWSMFEFGLGPIAGTYTTYGTGCRGSGQGGGGPACLTNNPNTTAISGTAGGNGAFAFPALPTSNITVTGFEIFTRGNHTLQTALYLADATGRPTGAALATSTLTVGPTDGWYNTIFTPTPIAAGQNIAIEFSGLPSGGLLNIASSGTASTHFYKPVGQATYNGPFNSYPWAWKINCGSGGGGAVPVLSATGVPVINSSFTVNLGFANPSAPVAMSVGGSDTIWSGIPLPFNLAPFGAPSCFVLASAEVLLPNTTNAAGAASQPMPIPNSSALVSRQFFDQWIVIDPANTLGIVTSNGGKGTIGRP
ncbi:MAG: S8 family serine peptidase [Planctomycetota bacterium]